MLRMLELTNRRASLPSRIHVRKCVLVDLVNVFKLKELDPEVCVRYNQNIDDLLMYSKTPGACCSLLNAITGKISSSSLEVLRCIMSDVLKTLLEELICFPLILFILLVNLLIMICNLFILVNL